MTLVELSVVCFFVYLFGIITGWLGGVLQKQRTGRTGGEVQ